MGICKLKSYHNLLFLAKLSETYHTKNYNKIGYKELNDYPDNLGTAIVDDQLAMVTLIFN
jgi:hypothetical protein